jgi:hypothetical protein
VAVYDLAPEGGPARLLWLVDPWERAPLEAWAGASFTINEIGAAAVFLFDRATTGWPALGIPLNAVTSIWPTAPLRREDPLMDARGEILALAAWGGRGVPAGVAGCLGEMAERLDRDAAALNRYWPGRERVGELIRINREKLAARCAAGGASGR